MHVYRLDHTPFTARTARDASAKERFTNARDQTFVGRDIQSSWGWTRKHMYTGWV